MGPAEIRAAVRPGSEGRLIRTLRDFEEWVSEQALDELAEPFTYVIDTSEDLWLDRGAVSTSRALGAGGCLVRERSPSAVAATAGAVSEVSNQSTGYCPDLGSWPAVADALDRVGLGRPDGFTYEVVFRRCVGCGEINVVREDDFVCVFCGGGLPASWNVA
ncbi:hypothetical protein ACIHCQ_22510 [Streptomyces sp. NPDC052236]|uniref:hypothetical protein n=1 Tax=Streptomyces sp. NPDC052236 TaxID=3365686 RepID=UPI0037CE4F67